MPPSVLEALDLKIDAIYNIHHLALHMSFAPWYETPPHGFTRADRVNPGDIGAGYV